MSAYCLVIHFQRLVHYSAWEPALIRLSGKLLVQVQLPGEVSVTLFAAREEVAVT